MKYYETKGNPVKYLIIHTGKMVEAEGIEPSSASDPQKGATYLVLVLIYLPSFQEQNPDRHIHRNS